MPFGEGALSGVLEMLYLNLDEGHGGTLVFKNLSSAQI